MGGENNTDRRRGALSHGAGSGFELPPCRILAESCHCNTLTCSC